MYAHYYGLRLSNLIIETTFLLTYIAYIPITYHCYNEMVYYV